MDNRRTSLGVEAMRVSFRRAGRVGLTVATACLLGWLGQPVAAQQPAPVGSQFLVNSYTTDSQRLAAVAVDSDGDFVVVWVHRDRRRRLAIRGVGVDQELGAEGAAARRVALTLDAVRSVAVVRAGAIPDDDEVAI